MQDFTYTEFFAYFIAGVGARGSNSFTALNDPLITNLFTHLLDALLDGHAESAGRDIETLAALGVRYELVRVAEPDGGTTLGFVERARPGEAGYRGWGATLVRLGAGRNRVYQAPHVRADEYSEGITLRAFREDARAGAALFAGTHRYANGPGCANADVAHATDNLFHALTVQLAQRGLAAGAPYWFIQLHGSAVRAGEPAITAADGAKQPQPTHTSPLVRINDLVDGAGHADMGVCGWREGPGEREDGAYLLCATDNAQGRVLEALGLRHTFLHFEIAWPLRNDYVARRAPGYAAVTGLLAAIRETLP